MANIRINLKGSLVNGMSVTFKTPCNSGEFEKLNVYHTGEYGLESMLFTMSDMHGTDISTLGDCFKKGAYLKVILDTEDKVAYLQNGDTNSYIEGREVFLTQEEWNALPDSKYSDGIKYRITDADSFDASNIAYKGSVAATNVKGAIDRLGNDTSLKSATGKNIYCNWNNAFIEIYGSASGFTLNAGASDTTTFKLPGDVTPTQQVFTKGIVLNSSWVPIGFVYIAINQDGSLTVRPDVNVSSGVVIIQSTLSKARFYTAS